MHLVHLALDPGDAVLKVDLVAEELARAFRGSKGVEGGGDDGGGGFLVVEDCEGGEGDDAEEDGEGWEPPEGYGFDV